MGKRDEAGYVETERPTELNLVELDMKGKGMS